MDKEADFKKVKVNYNIMAIFPDEDEIEEVKKKSRGRAVYYMETESGPIEEKEWRKKVEGLAEKYEEEEILDKLEKYCRNELPWMRKKHQIINQTEDPEERKSKEMQYEKQIREETLTMYANRLFENEAWAGKDLFDNVYLNGQYQLSMF